MCKMCDGLDEAGDERSTESCQDCGRMICFDVQSGDDVIDRAYVTSSGDLFCTRCGSAHDRAEEEAEAEEWMGWEPWLDAAEYDSEDSGPVADATGEP